MVDGIRIWRGSRGVVMQMGDRKGLLSLNMAIRAHSNSPFYRSLLKVTKGCYTLSPPSKRLGAKLNNILEIQVGKD